MTKEKLMMQLKNAAGYQVCYADVDKIVNNEFVKSLRKKLDMSQSVFAAVLGVTKKTIEKWEQGVNPIKGCSARLLYLIYNNPAIIKDLYSVNRVNIESHETEYTISNKKSVSTQNKIENNGLNSIFEGNNDFRINTSYNQLDNNPGYCC